MRVLLGLMALFILTGAPISTLAFAETRPILIGSDAAPPLSTSEQTGMLDAIVKEAFSRIGLHADIVQLPSERSLLNANQGVTDGDLVRIDGLDKSYENLVKVPEKTCDFDFVAFTKSEGVQLAAGWDSLKPYSVGIITGWKILEDNVHSRILTKVDSPEALFTLLEKDRVDMIIYNRHEGYGVITKMKLVGVNVVEPPLESREMFLYLNKRHHDIVDGLAESLREMKMDGTFSEITAKSLKKFLPE